MDLRRIGCEGMDWMHLLQGRDQWRAVVNTVMKRLGSINGKKFVD
jgi:hypothetical protein